MTCKYKFEEIKNNTNIKINKLIILFSKELTWPEVTIKKKIMLQNISIFLLSIYERILKVNAEFQLSRK